MATYPLLAVNGIDGTSAAFRSKLVRIAADLGLSADYLGAVMSLETGGQFTPDIRNPSSGATGLIQFLPSTAKILGTTTQHLASLSAEEQLDWVKKYYEKVGVAAIHTPIDHYMAVFSPAFIGKPSSTPMYRKGEVAYERNKGLDVDGDGVITVGNVATRFMGIVQRGEGRPRIPVDTSVLPATPAAEAGVSTAKTTAAFLIGAVLGWLGLRKR